MAKHQPEKAYNPQNTESRIYDFWLKGGYFHAGVNPDKKPYTIVIPPPNITGQLHMGHALDNTLQDILIRFRRMQGYEALWLPGTDHASIATEAKVVEALKKEGVSSKEEIGREKFLERAWQWKEQYGGTIVQQLKKLGSSCDWERERFTLDDGCSRAVNEVFVRLYEKGLIYRGERMINWCTHCKTSISDAEVEHNEREGRFWHLRYPLSDGSGLLNLATTRPETMLGDTAVAVHPQDERYKAFIGKTVRLPLTDREIPVVADEYVDPEFGTGVVKITPAHDPNDFEVGLRHNLPVINVFTEDGFINENGGRFRGLSIAEARAAVVKALEEEGYLIKVETIRHNVGSCYRCSTTVEPRVSTQWFVKMAPLAKPAIEAVKDGRIRFVPERFEKIYFNWMENIRDWCISRQLWWGHRIPAWYCDDCGEIVVARTEPEKCPKCGNAALRRDEDTLDTWFSSALWPFSTMGWPDRTPELDYFYPTSTLVTGYDIIFFWVARMIFSGLEHTGKVPFDTVYFHGIVRDAQGRKMSKSLGNGIDPLEEIAKYGADALRFTLVTGNSPGNDMRYTEEKVRASGNFANKLWNAFRFIYMNLDDEPQPLPLPDAEDLAPEDKWVLSKLNTLCAEMTENLEKFELGIAVQKLYDFVWDIFCDWYIELSKVRLQQNGETRRRVQAVLTHVLRQILKLLHPFMPFITEEIYQILPHECESIMIAPWPVPSPEMNFAAEEKEFGRIVEAIGAIRSRRAEMNVPPSRKTRILVDTEHAETFRSGAEFFSRLAGVSEVGFGTPENPAACVSIITESAKIFIPLDDLVDKEEERRRLERELKATEDRLQGISAQLNNPNFVNRAPAAVVEKQRETQKALEAKLTNIRESLAAL